MHRPEVDFTQDLKRALEYAPLDCRTDSGETSVEDLERIGLELRALGRMADSKLIIFGRPNRQPNEVFASSFRTYPHLIRQAYNVASGGQYAPEEARVSEILKHEVEHARASRQVSPNIHVLYGMKFTRFRQPGDETHKVFLQPFCEFAGHMRKIDYAFIATAPSVPSELDLSVMRVLGYESPEEIVLRRAGASAIKIWWGNLLNVLDKGALMTAINE